MINFSDLALVEGSNFWCDHMDKLVHNVYFFFNLLVRSSEMFY